MEHSLGRSALQASQAAVLPATSPSAVQAWQAAWWAAESGEATRKLDQIWDSDFAWEPAPQVYDVLEDGQPRWGAFRPWERQCCCECHMLETEQ